MPWTSQLSSRHLWGRFIPKSEARSPNQAFHLHLCKTTTDPFRISDFGLLSGFGDSDFGFGRAVPVAIVAILPGLNLI